jgi:glycosyltransferase involved in cell wall biosynthesis
MKILQVIELFAPRFGGSINSVFLLSKNLAERGHKVTIITADYEFDKAYSAELQDIGIEVLPFHSILAFASYIFTPSMKSWLKTNLKDFDVIHMHNFRSYQNNIVRIYANKYNIPYVLQARGSVLPFLGKQILKRSFDLVWGYSLLQDASRIIALTDVEVAQYEYMRIKKEKIEKVPNGININEFRSLPSQGRFKYKYKIDTSEKIILYLGRIHWIKGLDLLIESFTDLSKDRADVKLVLVGPDDGYKNILERKIDAFGVGEKTILTGPLHKYEKLEAYVDADVYVLPSKYETFPNTVLEACACGTPVIVTDRCGIADIIDDRAGLVVPYDKDCLREAIMRILNEDKLRQDFSVNGKLLVNERFNWGKIVEQVERIYLNCILAKD